MALITSVATFAYDAAEEGSQYSCGSVKVIGLANGKVAVTDVWLGAGETAVTIPSEAHATYNNTTSENCDLTFEVQQVGTGSCAIWVAREDASFLASVTSLTISEGVTTIAANAFSSATSLTSIYFNGTTAPTIGADAFPSDILTSCPAYVTTWEAKVALQTAGFVNTKYFTVNLWDGCYQDQSWHNGHLVDLTLNRSFYADAGWYTLCLPATVSQWNMKNIFGDDVRIMELSSSSLVGDELQLTFSEVTENLEAGKPYLIDVSTDKVYDDADRYVFQGVSFDNTVSTTVSTAYASMFGSFSTMSLDNTKYYLGPNNFLYQPETSVSMAGYRAYFTFSTSVPKGAPARIVFRDQTTTDVENVQRDNVQCTKVLRDGHVHIVRGGKIYTLDGQRIQ